MEERLRAILSMVNDWLKFAEMKNGALLTLSSGIVFTLLKNYSELGLRSTVEWWFVGGVGCLSIAGIVCLLSFIPVLKIPWFELERKPGAGDNLFFFVDISKFTAADYVKALLVASGDQARAPTAAEIQLAVQAIVNAGIARKKYLFFNAAVWLLLIGLLSLGITGLGQL
jgi:hypothetical protein